MKDAVLSQATEPHISVYHNLPLTLPQSHVAGEGVAGTLLSLGHADNVKFSSPQLTVEIPRPENLFFVVGETKKPQTPWHSQGTMCLCVHPLLFQLQNTLGCSKVVSFLKTTLPFLTCCSNQLEPPATWVLRRCCCCSPLILSWIPSCTLQGPY